MHLLFPLVAAENFVRTLTELYGASPPLLRRPKLMRHTLVVISTIAILFGTLTATIDITILPLGLLGAGAFIIVLQLITAPFHTEPPKTFATLGDASRRLVGLTIAMQPVQTEAEVLAAVQQICAELLDLARIKSCPTLDSFRT